ncbi:MULTISPECIES: DedA family protein [unclassified Amycolatopsis]|uniref:DedA family protein n=1 Tax=unclassified Amycolatopsis TaxID=2618356 RepID=UPI002E1E4E28|nr:MULTISPECIES: DedA family protein [unclassified Amycolatopsis]
MNVVSIEAAGVGVSWLDTAGPLLVWVIVLSFVLVECALIIGLFLPGDSLLFGAGVVLAQHGSDLNAWLLSGAALIVAVLGNQIGYYIGRTGGSKLLARRDGKVLNRQSLERAQEFLDRRGFFAIVAARWIPWIRTLAPLIAGAARMDPRRFMLATALGGLLWVPTLVLLGYYGAGLLDVLPWLKTAALWASVAFFVFGTAYGVLRYRQEMRRPIEKVEETDDARA